MAVCAAAGTLCAAPLLGSSRAAPGPGGDRAQGTPVRGHAPARRVGGAVRRAWPASGRRPRTPQARWLARQVGAIAPRPCARQWRQARRRCHLGAARARPARAPAAAMGAVGGDPGAPPGPRARIAGAVPGPAPGGPVTVSSSSPKLPLQLVRSYAIPADDPAYQRLLNWSWTYDSAVSAAAFAAGGDKDNAGQLLDQLVALQYTDGSLEIAFNTATGEGARVFRSGTVAWLGLAAATYDRAFASNRYRDAEQRAADYLLSLQTPSGLIKGGPDVSWVSSEHNLVAYVFLARLAGELQGAGKASNAARYQAAASTLAAAINANLLVSDAAGSRFRQGLKDDTPALDVQALGAMYLQGTGQPALAAQVLAYAQATFGLADRSVTESADPATYNLTWSAPGPFSGYAPYAGPGAPDVLWAEGSSQMRLATAALGQDTGALDKSIASWAAITKDQGPLQADRKVTTGDYEYHPWPASTAAAWTLLAQSAPTFFAAPLPPATAVVTGWTKVRGGNLITTYADGRVDMTAGAGGERRVLAASTSADYTVTANVTLLSGVGYGIYVRTTADAGTNLTGYCVQLDRGFGQIIVRPLQSDVELNPPVARIPLPAGFVWYGVPHTLGVTVKGNAMSITLDGGQAVTLPDLAALWAASVKYTYPAGTTAAAAPATGGYGLRTWSDGLLTLQQLTVGPAG